MIGKSIANRPYMYLPLKGDTNDYSTNAQNPSNTGVTTTTGQFGESNGAYEWGADIDVLSWSSSVGNSIAEKLNLNSTILWFIYLNNTNYSLARVHISQYASSSQSAFNNLYRSDGSYTRAYRPTNWDNGQVSDFTINNVITDDTWEMHSIRTNKLDATNVEYFFNDGSNKNTKSDMALMKEDATAEFNIGERADNTRSFIGKMHTFRIYDVTLSDGALKILNNEKGRIRA